MLYFIKLLLTRTLALMQTFGTSTAIFPKFKQTQERYSEFIGAH